MATSVPTPKYWVSRDKFVKSKGVVESSLSHRYSYSGRTKPPSMYKMVHSETSAMYFQWTVMRRVDHKTFAVRCASALLAGKVVSLQQNARVFVIDSDFNVTTSTYGSTGSTGTSSTWTCHTATEAFAKFMMYYESGTAEPSIYVDGTGLCTYVIAAVDSPFFYPLNKTSVKYLTTDDNRRKTHVKYLHEQISEYWNEIVEVVDPVSVGYRMNLTKISTTGEELLSKNSVLMQMIVALAHTSVGVVDSAKEAPVYKMKDVHIANTVLLKTGEDA